MTPQPELHAAPVFAKAPLPSIEVRGPQHVLSYVNAAFCRLVGKSRLDLVGRPFADVVVGGNEFVPIFNEVCATGEAATHVSAVEAEPEPSHWLYTMWPSLDEHEQPVGVIMQVTKARGAHESTVAINEALLVAALRQHQTLEVTEAANTRLQLEIAERTKAEKALREIDKRRHEFLATLAHELRNPLAPIGTAAQIIRLAGSPDPTIAIAGDMIARQVRRITRLVDDLLDVARLDAGKIALNIDVVDLSESILNAVESVRDVIDSRNQQIDVSLQQDPPLCVHADALRVEQIVSNLLTNAAKYTPPGGRILVTARHEGSMAVVSVCDNGIGIDSEMLEPIFEIFTQIDHSTTHAQGGLGVGLKLVKDLMRLHDGTVEARSAGANQGSEFIVRFPAADQAPDCRPDDARHVIDGDPSGSPPHRILVIDDNSDHRESMARLLRMWGHEVSTSEDGLEGVETALRIHPEVALVDIGLPKLGGYEVARRIRSSPGGHEMLLVAITGYGSDGDKKRAIEAGFDAHLTKPADYAMLTELLRAVHT